MVCKIYGKVNYEHIESDTFIIRDEDNKGKVVADNPHVKTLFYYGTTNKHTMLTIKNCENLEKIVFKHSNDVFHIVCENCPALSGIEIKSSCKEYTVPSLKSIHSFTKDIIISKKFKSRSNLIGLENRYGLKRNGDNNIDNSYVEIKNCVSIKNTNQIVSDFMIGKLLIEGQDHITIQGIYSIIICQKVNKAVFDNVISCVLNISAASTVLIDSGNIKFMVISQVDEVMLGRELSVHELIIEGVNDINYVQGICRIDNIDCKNMTYVDLVAKNWKLYMSKYYQLNAHNIEDDGHVEILRNISEPMSYGFNWPHANVKISEVARHNKATLSLKNIVCRSLHICSSYIMSLNNIKVENLTIINESHIKNISSCYTRTLNLSVQDDLQSRIKVSGEVSDIHTPVPEIGGLSKQRNFMSEYDSDILLDFNHLLNEGDA